MPVEADHAVVIGASITGLVTARVLAEHFARVTIVERDPLVEDPAARRGVPQVRQVHGLLPAGLAALDELYGDFGALLRARRCAEIDLVQQSLTLFPTGWVKRAPSGVIVLGATRWTIELTLRDATLRTANISVHQGRATGLVANADRGRVTGIRLQDEAGTAETIEADLVVDASGRATRTPKWLQELGYPAPAQSSVHPFMGYATVFCAMAEDDWPGEVRSVDALPQPPDHRRGGIVMPTENGTLAVCAVGYARDYPPADPAGFTEFLRTGISPILYEIWRRATPISEIHTSRTAVNRLNRWHELERRPAGFIAVGDAIAAFNPVYGQGMSVAALEAERLRELLRATDDLDAVVQRFPQEAFDVAGFAWSASTSGDLAWSTSQAENMATEAVDAEADRFLREVMRLAVEDAEVATTLFRALGFMRPDLLDTPELRERIRRDGDLPRGLPDDLSLPRDIAAALAASAPRHRADARTEWAV